MSFTSSLTPARFFPKTSWLLAKISAPHASQNQYNAIDCITLHLFILLVPPSSFFSFLFLLMVSGVVRRDSLTSPNCLSLLQFLCTVVAILLHYFFMSTFAWMFVEGLHIYRMQTEQRNINYGAMRFYYAIGWGVPAIITGDVDPRARRRLVSEACVRASTPSPRSFTPTRFDARATTRVHSGSDGVDKGSVTF